MTVFTKRYELSNDEWNRIKKYFTERNEHTMGRPSIDNRTVLNGILWILRSGAPWRDLPERYGKWNTIYKRFCLWQQNGLFEKIFSELITDADFQEICIDSSMCKVHQSANGVKKDRRRKSAYRKKQRRKDNKNTCSSRCTGKSNKDKIVSRKHKR